MMESLLQVLDIYKRPYDAKYPVVCMDESPQQLIGETKVPIPKHGSWLNMAEIELNVLNGQCLNRRIDSIEEVRKEVDAWQKHRNHKNAKIN